MEKTKQIGQQSQHNFWFSMPSERDTDNITAGSVCLT